MSVLSPIVMVPQNSRYIVERCGRFSRVLESGLSFKLPLLDRIAYKHSLKEAVIRVDSQNAITKDNVKLRIDGVLYFKIVDPVRASYEVRDPTKSSVILLAQTSMRSEIGKLELDRTFEERETLNDLIRKQVNSATEKWGIECMRYEIKDIKPPEQIKRAMELQSESERVKRSKILESEGKR
jgi:regulator of protease activity HflC (stomatin/prohibitin superfamily)